MKKDEDKNRVKYHPGKEVDHKKGGDYK